MFTDGYYMNVKINLSKPHPRYRYNVTYGMMEYQDLFSSDVSEPLIL